MQYNPPNREVEGQGYGGGGSRADVLKCPEGSGKVLVDGNCECPEGMVEGEGTCEDDCGEKIPDDELEKVAEFMNTSKAKILTVTSVEAKGKPFRSNGDPVILFERHYFHKFTNGRYDESHPEISNSSWGGDGTYNSQMRKLNLALTLDRDAAYKSISVSIFQIMGDNFERAGYSDVSQFYNDLTSLDMSLHLNAFAKFINFDTRLVNALKENDWKKFAEIYNGPNYLKNKYDSKL